MRVPTAPAVSAVSVSTYRGIRIAAEFMKELRRLTITRSGPRQARVKESILELRQNKTSVKSEMMLAGFSKVLADVSETSGHGQQLAQVAIEAAEREKGSASPDGEGPTHD